MTLPWLERSAKLDVIAARTMDNLWVSLLKKLLDAGEPMTPRGKATLELSPQLLHLGDARSSALTIPERNLNYGFAVAEHFWIMMGRRDVGFIIPYNHRMAEFSDDGRFLFGAYGPWVRAQLPYVVKTLRHDDQSRQAVLTIWQQSPPITKDVPCTVSMQFLIREGQLNLIVNMRSSDAWLGLPYDIYTFSRIQDAVAAELKVVTGSLTLLAGSSHIYIEHLSLAKQIVEKHEGTKQIYLPPHRSLPNQDIFMAIESASHWTEVPKEFEINDDALRDAFNVLSWYNNGKHPYVKPLSPLHSVAVAVRAWQKEHDGTPKP